MKEVFFMIILVTLFITGLSAIAQNESNQFEMTQNEIINLIKLPNPTFNPNIIQKSIIPLIVS